MPTSPAGLAPFDDTGSFSVTRRTGLVYASAATSTGTQQRLALDLYAPDGDARRSHPAVVFAHGGGFSRGSRAEGADAMEALASRGYVGVSIDYRRDTAAPDVTYPLNAGERRRVDDAVSDMKAAVRYLRANAHRLGVDPARIAVMGSSAGAVMALTTALTPDDPGEVPTEPRQSSAVCTAVSVMGASDPGLAGADDAGALFLHGDADRVVPYAVAQQTEAAMRARGLPTLLRTFPGEGHSLEASDPRVAGAVMPWLRTHLARTTEPCT